MTAELILDPPVSTGDLAGEPHRDDDFLILSTVHSAKGGEWRAVHLIRASDGSFPSDMATGSRREIEEERRLFYVALTRAKEHLHIYTPLRYHLGGQAHRGDRHSYGQRTRFLPPDLDELMDHRAVRSEPADVAISLPAIQLHDAVAESLDALW
jgi:DNA helicase-2/ATP-dependent DNA helicase PcrA